MNKTDSKIHQWDPFTKKHQPQTISDFIGNERALNPLKAVLDDIRRNRGYLVFWPYGTGKTSLGWAIGKELGAEDCDIKFASLRDYRDLKMMRRTINYFWLMPRGLARVFIFDEAHILSDPIQLELLGWLDNPPKTLHLIFCTAEPKKVIVPLQQRCFQVALQPLEFKDCMKLLRRICMKEKVELDRQVLKGIAKNSDGIPRNLVNGLLAEMAQIRKSKDPGETSKVKLRAVN